MAAFLRSLNGPSSISVFCHRSVLRTGIADHPVASLRHSLGSRSALGGGSGQGARGTRRRSRCQVLEAHRGRVSRQVRLGPQACWMERFGVIDCSVLPMLAADGMPRGRCKTGLGLRGQVRPGPQAWGSEARCGHRFARPVRGSAGWWCGAVDGWHGVGRRGQWRRRGEDRGPACGRRAWPARVSMPPAATGLSWALAGLPLPGGWPDSGHVA